MYQSASLFEKQCLLKLSFPILEIAIGEKVNTTDPLVFGLFVDVFDTYSQDEIGPVFQSIIKIDERIAIEKVRSLPDSIKKELQYFLLKVSGDDKRLIMATSMLIRSLE